MLKIFLVLLNIFMLFKVYSLDNKKIIVIVDNLRFRTTPAIDSTIISNLKCGDILDFISKDENIARINNIEGYWYKVKYNTQIGFVFGFYTKDYNNEKFVICENEGKVLIFNNTKLISSILYNPKYYNIQYQSNLKIVTIDNVEVLNDNFLIKHSVSGPENSGGEAYLFELYNDKGQKILNSDIVPYYVYINNYLIILNNLFQTEYGLFTDLLDNKFDTLIFNSKGDFIKTLKYILNKNNQKTSNGSSRYIEIYKNYESNYLSIYNSTFILLYDLNDLKLYNFDLLNMIKNDKPDNYDINLDEDNKYITFNFENKINIKFDKEKKIFIKTPSGS